jgi:phosphatidylserine/phosphatidylglycerophosphate/cardiolipin synthase-like enzyme
MASAPSPSHSLVVEPVDGRALVLSSINSASRTLDLGIYEVNDSLIVSALIAAQNRHVSVRVMYNWYSFDSATQENEISPTINQLARAGVLCRPAPRTFEVTHEKVCVIDGSSALVMTFNLVAEYFESTRDFGILTTVPSEVAEVASVFEADWNSQSVSPSVPSLVWSPSNSRSRLMALIGSADRTLEVYNEELSDPGVLGALVSAAHRGVKVRVIAAVLKSGGTANANAAGVTYLTSNGVPAVCKGFPVSTPSGTVPIYIHAKVVVADFGAPNARAFVGSENFSCVSLDDNRECGVLVGEPSVLARIESTFESDWAQPSVRVSPDTTPLSPCPTDPAARTAARVALRTVG